MFEKARLQLTMWYLLIIMTISILFSFVIYLNVDSEFNKFEKPHYKIVGKYNNKIVLQNPRIDSVLIQEARTRFIISLSIINGIILVLAGTAGYFLAGRTLKPIKEMVDEQNRFISDSSHELRTPLTSLRSEIEVNLRNKNLSVSSAKKLLESNLEEVISLQILSDRLLQLTQIESLKKVNTKVSIQECIDQAIKKLNGTVKKKNVVIKKQLNNTFIYGVEDRIIELFVILIDNAIKYSPQKSTITISMKNKKNIVEITVSDTGIGIDKKDLPFIFDRFYRTNESRSKDINGYGLGLSIAKKIVEQHNGTITVTSSVQKGSAFKVSLPVTHS